jgi:hypothetical protein
MQDELDNLIDHALSGYASAEPLAGLEGRVLTRVRTAARSRGRRWVWVLGALASVLAAILIVLFASKPRPVPVANVERPPVPVESAPAPVAVVQQSGSRPATSRRRAASPHVLPKREQFPTISPLTSEERMLVEMAESHPQELLVRPVEQIEIKPIQIAPLQIDGSQ